MVQILRSGTVLLLALLVAASGGMAANSAKTQTTKWTLRPAPGIDAVLMIGAASGDVMQAEIYADTIAFVRSRMSAEGLAAMKRLDEVIRIREKKLIGPSLAYFLSAGPVESIDDVIASADNPDRRLRPALEKLPGWRAERYAAMAEVMPDVAVALKALKKIGFEDWYADTSLPEIEKSIDGIRPAVSGYDIIPEQERLLGRDLRPEVEFLVVRFSRPYGIKITGQRFVAFYDWPAHTVLHIAVHEIFHPPFNLNDRDLRARAEKLLKDPWVKSIVENHDPKFGYNSFEGVMNEDSTQALDQIVSERLGIAKDPGERWRHSDGGMHMIAAALYHAMKEDGFAGTGGVYAEWLRSALRRGLLTPEEIRRRAALVVGEAAVQRWYEVMQRAR